MMYAAVLLAFVVVVTADVPKEDIAKMDDLDVLLNRLTARAQNLKDKIDGKLNNIAEADRKSKNMILRMDRMNVNDGSFKCPRGENGKQTMFKCGTGQQCIGNILVCDNVADCLDGSDEDPDYCIIPLFEGQKWVVRSASFTCHLQEGGLDKVTMVNYPRNIVRSDHLPSNVDFTMWAFWTYGTAEVRSFGFPSKYIFATTEFIIPPYTIAGNFYRAKYAILPGEKAFSGGVQNLNLDILCGSFTGTTGLELYKDITLDTYLT